LIVLVLVSVLMFRLVVSDVLADVFWLMFVMVPELIFWFTLVLVVVLLLLFVIVPELTFWLRFVLVDVLADVLLLLLVLVQQVYLQP
jgi:hypothetical protein